MCSSASALASFLLIASSFGRIAGPNSTIQIGRAKRGCQIVGKRLPNSDGLISCYGAGAIRLIRLRNGPLQIGHRERDNKRVILPRQEAMCEIQRIVPSREDPILEKDGTVLGLRDDNAALCGGICQNAPWYNCPVGQEWCVKRRVAV